MSLSAPYTVITIAGNGTSGKNDNTDGLSATFSSPRGLAMDEKYIYVADSSSHAIRKIELGTWNVSTIVGNGSSGTTDNTSGTSARLNNPVSLVKNGNFLYVADFTNHAIRKVDITNSNFTTTFLGLIGSSGLVNGSGSFARLNNPLSVVTDGVSLYYSDNGGNCIKRVDLSSVSVRQLNGTVTACTSGNASGAMGTAKYNAGRLGMLGSAIYVADSGSNNLKLLQDNYFLRFTGDGTDLSANGGYNATVGGGSPSQTPDHNNLASSAMNFSGSDYYNGSNSSNLVPSTLTLSAWVKITSLPSSGVRMAIVSKYDGSTSGYMLSLYNNAGIYSFDWGINATINACSITTSTLGAIPTGKWIHLAATQNGSTCNLYVSADFNTSASPGSLTNPANSFQVAAVNGGSYFNGAISDLRIYSRILSLQEIRLLATMIPNGLQFFLPHTNSVSIDYSIHAYSPSGGPVAVVDRNFINVSARQHNSLNNFNLSGITDFPGGDAPRTICSFTYQTTFPGLATVGIYGTTGGNNSFGIQYNNVGPKVQLYEGSTNVLSPTQTINTATQYSVCATHDPNQSPTTNLYFNGTNIGSTTYTFNTQTSGSLYIGQDLSAVNGITGRPDDFRVYNRALTASEINYLSTQ